MKTSNQIKCPKCGTKIVDELLLKQFEQVREHALKESSLKIKEKEKVINDLKLKLDDAKKRAEQGSVQLQGEIQEQEIIKILHELYPADEITQSKKGSNGADVLQTVKLQNGNTCGKIYYESKSTRSWSNDWIPKLKQDNLVAKADILVLITQALPKNIEKYGMLDGVWVCGLDMMKEFSLVLRFILIKLHSVATIEHGKEAKMEQLYKYITGNAFKNTFKSVIDGFLNLQESHNSEKIKMQRFWKERELILEQVLTSSIDFYSSLKGIAGTAVPEIEMLESPRVD